MSGRADDPTGAAFACARMAASGQSWAERARNIGCRLVGPAGSERGEALAAAVDVGDQDLGREASQGHIVDQVAAKERDGRINHWGHLPWVSESELSSQKHKHRRPNLCLVNKISCVSLVRKVCIFVSIISFLNICVVPMSLAYIVDMAASGEVVFFLDDKGCVWAFRRPLSFEDPIKLPNLKNIKKISPFLALDESGHVYRWALAKETQMPDGDTVIAAYTTPELVPNLDKISMIVHDGWRDVVVKNDQEIIEWEAVPRNGFGVKGYRPNRSVFSGRDIRSISAKGDGGILVMSRDGSVFGLRLDPIGRSQENVIINKTSFILSSPATAIYLNSRHVIVLSEDGRVRYWKRSNAAGNVTTNGELSNLENSPRLADVA